MTRLLFGAVMNLTNEFLAGDWLGLRRLTNELEKHGYHSAFVMDHLTSCRAWVFDNRHTNSESDFLECWTSLAALAASTRTIRLGPLVQCAGFRNPALVAKIASSLDRISGGRLEFSMGAGWKQDEHFSYGYTFGTPAERVARLRESLIIVKKIWTEDRPSFTGKYFSIGGLEFGPRPVQQPHPPIWIGGGGEKLLLKVVAELADVWDVWCTPEQLAHKLEVLKRYCDGLGRRASKISVSVSPEVFIAKKSEIARKKARDSALPGSDPIEFVNRRIVGSPEECIDQISRYADLGATHFSPMIHTLSESERQLFAEAVMSHFA